MPSYAMQPPLCLIDSNPASRINLQKTDARDSVWSPEAIDAFLEAADSYRPSIGLAVRLAVQTAQRQSDVLKMKWSDYHGDTISVTQNKTKAKVFPLVFGDLKQRLDTMEKKSVFIVADEATGKPYTADHFKKLFAKTKIRAQKAHPEIDFSDIKFIDLRRTAAVRLAEAGCTAFELSAITGHSITQSQQILEVYVPRNATMARAAATKLQQKFG